MKALLSVSFVAFQTLHHGYFLELGIGDLLNVGHNFVVIVSGCGWLNVLDLFNDNDLSIMDKEIK